MAGPYKDYVVGDFCVLRHRARISWLRKATDRKTMQTAPVSKKPFWKRHIWKLQTKRISKYSCLKMWISTIPQLNTCTLKMSTTTTTDMILQEKDTYIREQGKCMHHTFLYSTFYDISLSLLGQCVCCLQCLFPLLSCVFYGCFGGPFSPLFSGSCFMVFCGVILCYILWGLFRGTFARFILWQVVLWFSYDVSLALWCIFHSIFLVGLSLCLVQDMSEASSGTPRSQLCIHTDFCRHQNDIKIHTYTSKSKICHFAQQLPQSKMFLSLNTSLCVMIEKP